jgi:hypothetical protein
MTLERLASLILVFFGYGISSTAQTTTDVDTFTVNSALFKVTELNNWYSSKTQNEIQLDSTWNYQMHYAPQDNPKNVRAVIRLHITNNSNYVPTADEQKQFDNTCTYESQVVSNWPCIYYEFQGRKDINCRSCGLIYVRAYSFVLNFYQKLEIEFIGQGKWTEIMPLTLDFCQFTSTFASTNGQALSTFRIYSLYNSSTFDSTNICGYPMHVEVPDGFAFNSNMFGGYKGIESLQMSIVITGTMQNDKDPVHNSNKTDTSVVQKSDYNSDNFSTTYSFRTQRILVLSNQDQMQLTFNLTMGQSSEMYYQYYQWFLRYYADRFVMDNMGSK